MFVKPAGLPVMHADWQHNGGNTPYNLLYSKGRVYIFPRKKQGCYQQPDWTSGFAWLEMAGGIITFNRESYVNLDQATIAQELAQLVL